MYRSFIWLWVAATTLPTQMGAQGLLIGERLACIAFDALGVRDERERFGPMVSPQDLVPEGAGEVSRGALELNEQLVRDINRARVERLSDVRFQQMAVNTVVFALTQEGSIARREMDG